MFLTVTVFSYVRYIDLRKIREDNLFVNFFLNNKHSVRKRALSTLTMAQTRRKTDVKLLPPSYTDNYPLLVDRLTATIFYTLYSQQRRHETLFSYEIENLASSYKFKQNCMPKL